MPNFTELVAAALDTDNALEAAARVHRVVYDELQLLDATVEPELTGYFNHSYVPDMIVHWKEAGKVVDRPVYLRHSLRSSRASGDLSNDGLQDKGSLILSLSREEPEVEKALARETVRSGSRPSSLITTVPAIDDLVQTSETYDPVIGVVRANVLRSARGVFVEDDVEKLVLPRNRRIQPADFEAFAAVVRANFSEEAALQIGRVSGIVEQALAETPTSIEVPGGSGRLSSTEIRELVPYLLGLEGVTQDRAFWLSVARLIDFKDIERHWESFSGLDVTPLAGAGSELWQATRALLTIRSEAIDDDSFDRTPRWVVKGRTLTAEVGNWNISFAHAGTKLKATGRDASPARWESLAPVLADYTVTGVGLAGVVTQSTYGALEASDMKARIGSFIAGADDVFHVPSLTVTTGVGSDAAAVEVDFSEMMLRAKPEANLVALVHIALDVLGYRSPTATGEVEDLLTGSRSSRSDLQTRDPIEES